MKYSFEKINDLKKAKFLYSINSERSARHFSINKKKFSFDDHVIWMKKIIKEKKEEIYLVKNNNAIIGVLRAKKLRGYWYLSWVIKLNCRGRGYGKEMLKQFIRERYSKMFFAKIHKKNIFSIRMAKYSGLKRIKNLKNFSIFSN